MASVWLIEYKKLNFRGWRLWMDAYIGMWMNTEHSRDVQMEKLRREENNLQFRAAEYRKVEAQ